MTTNHHRHPKYKHNFLTGSVASRNKRRHNYYLNPKARCKHIPHTAREILGIPKPKTRKRFYDISSDSVLEAVAQDLDRESMRQSVYSFVILIVQAFSLGYHCKSGNKSLAQVFGVEG